MVEIEFISISKWYHDQVPGLGVDADHFARRLVRARFARVTLTVWTAADAEVPTVRRPIDVIDFVFAVEYRKTPLT